MSPVASVVDALYVRRVSHSGKLLLPLALVVTLVFALSGMLTGGLLQADVTAYERSFGLSHETVAYWLSVFSFLSALGGWTSGALADRLGAMRVFRFAVVLSGAGCMLFAAGAAGGGRFGNVTLLSGYLSAGVGIGALVIGNVLAAAGGDGRACRSVNRLHGFHGLARLGAIPVSIAALTLGWRTSYLLLGTVFLVLAALPTYSPARCERPDGDPQPSSPPLDEAGFSRALRAVVVGFGAYMLAEMTAVTWMTAYFEEGRGWSPAFARIGYGLFLAGLVAGRFLIARLWPEELPPRIVVALAALHVPAVAGIVWGGDLIAPVALFVAGACEGPGWPSLYAWMIRRAPGREGRTTSAIYLACCAGIIVATSGSGWLVENAGWTSVFLAVIVTHAVFTAIFWRLARSG